jgi:glycosyltransferase involved in cell wall biosynthesis
MSASQIRIAVLIPCFNEAAAIGKVIADFRQALPMAEVYVFDNNSSDDTVAIARAAGAQVRSERHQGKGHVVRRMFADVDAEIYLLVDGDATYDAPSAPAMIERLIEDHLDMVVAHRVDQVDAAYRAGHRTGNMLLTKFLTDIFGRGFDDILSGYRVFSRRFVKSMPVLSDGFEIETELSVHALEMSMPVAEIKTPYYARPAGSVSKLNTWRDGFRILGTIMKLYRTEKPLRFFTTIAITFAAMSVILSIPIMITFVEDGLVPRLPTALLSVGIMLVAVMSLFAGLGLDTVSRGRREAKLMRYIAEPWLSP